MTRLLYGNFTCESDWAGAAARPPKTAVRSHLAGAASALRVLGREEDALWREGDEAPTPEPWDAILAWGETEVVAALRDRPAAPATHVSPPTWRSIDADWLEALWSAYPDPDIARTVNDKRFAHALRARHGWSLPGAAVVSTMEELECRIADINGSWVVKAPFAAAGRERWRQRGPLSGDGAIRVERLLKRYDCLLLEPWVARVTDAGICGLVLPNETWLSPPYTQDVDTTGVCRSIAIGDRPDEPQPFEQAATIVAHALATEGYVGPFAVDGYRAQIDGRLCWQPLSEINARLSFGLIAQARAIQTRLGRYQYLLP